MKAILGKLNDELLLNLAIRSKSYCSHVDAAVAYAAGNDHPLIQRCKENGQFLRFFGLLDDSGAVAATVLAELLAWGPSKAEARLVKGNFHAKVIWWRGFGAYVGSANLTHKAWFNNVEAGIFFEEDELAGSDVGADLDALFEHLVGHSIPVTTEVVAKLEKLATERQAAASQEAKLREKFNQMFGHLAENPGLTVKPAKGAQAAKPNLALQRFAEEWMKTLQLMRGLSKEFHAYGLRPTWVDADAHPAVHFDQFLHAYYYDYVRGGEHSDDDDDPSSAGKVEAAFQKHRADPAAALKEAVQWWASLPEDRYGEEEFIRVIGPDMRTRLSREAVKAMDLPAFTEALRNVNAFRMHARQVKNVDFGLPADHYENMEQRVERLCAWLWAHRSSSGRTVRDVVEFVLWGTSPSDMEQRLWMAAYDDAYRLPHFGQSSLGEAVGWARPDEYPPRNNRTNKALRSLGHDVDLFDEKRSAGDKKP